MTIWREDLLDYQTVGKTFTNFVKTLDKGKVISIEAGFGRGKTFFRKAWAKHLRTEGEIVVEIDLQMSDHSGDPLITLIAALVEALPREVKGQKEKIFDTAKKFGAIGGRTAARIALRSGADELFDAISDRAIDELGDFNALDNVITDLGNEMSKAAGQLIATQMAAERVRKNELPEQLSALHLALTNNTETNRVIVIVDELDRCHPNYAIAALEAMKLVFKHTGFVFCLMVNAEYLEALAGHQLGVSSEEEQYLDKFVDIRLSLNAEESHIKSATIELANRLPLATPFGEDEAFSISRAAELAGDLAVETKLPLRKIKRVLLQVEMAMRCYPEQPLDASLLVFLAFERSVGKTIDPSFLPRSQITPEKNDETQNAIKGLDSRSLAHQHQVFATFDREISEKFPELIDLPCDRYGIADSKDRQTWHLVYQCLGQRYLPIHRDVLGAIADLLV